MTNLIAPSGNTFGKRNRQPSARKVVATPIGGNRTVWSTTPFGVSHTLHA